MADLTGILPPAWQEKRRKEAAPRPIEEQITIAMTGAGIIAPDYIEIDGEIHRYKTTGKDKSGWYVFYPDGIVAGKFGDWKEGVEMNFCADVGRTLTEQEIQDQKRRMAQAKIQREQERKIQHKEAAESVQSIWDSSSPASADHPYLKRKGIQYHGARLASDGRLIVPLHDEKGVLSSIQYISHDGAKMYFKGGKTSGCFNIIGAMDGKELYIAEGFATAATIHEETGKPCAVAYSAANIPKVAESLHDTIKKITIIADNDESGVGLKSAEKAAKDFGCAVIMPPIKGDANDFHLSGGDLAALLEPPKQADWLEWVDDFCSQPAPISWHIKGWWQKNSLMMVHGPSGGGKTFYVLDSALRMASGIDDWCGNKVRPGTAVYLAGEGHHGLRGRIAAWRQANNVKASKMLVSKSGCDLNTPLGFQKVIDAISMLPESPDIIIVDTLHRFLNGDENSAVDAKSMLDACSSLMEKYDCSVILVHHTGVSAEAQGRARGSSAWKGALDIEISVTPTGKGALQVSQKKNKDAEECDPLHFELKSIAIDGWIDEDGEQVTSAVLIQANAPQERVKESKHDKTIRTFERAWEHTGSEIINNKVYVSRAGFVSFCVDVMGQKESTARQNVKESYSRGLIFELLNNGVIRSELHGWVLLDEVRNAALMMILNSGVKTQGGSKT